MKIEKIILRNFAAVKNAMSANEILIDFSKSINKICLLIGPNGSGKTTILSLLNPFADLGNLDVRNGNNLILKNKDGYKEIHIRKDEDYYIIKHFYTHHKDKNHSVKSYIEKNGNELNINGNVTSFKEYVREELHIEPDYLKLIRLGDNVTSLIDMTSTERKNYMSKIMDDIGIYLDYYKSVNNKLRQLNEMISHTIDKINKLDVIDKKDLEKEIKSLRKEINEHENLFMDKNKDIAVYESTISSIEDYQNLHEKLSNITKRYKKMLGILEKKKNLDNTDIDYYNSCIREYEKTIAVSENEIAINKKMIEKNLEQLNSYQEQLRSYKIQLQKEEETTEEIDRINTNLIDLRKKINEFEKNLDGFIPSFSKEEFESFVIFLKNTQQILGRTYEFGKSPVSKVVELMKEKKNVTNYINSHLLELDDDIDQKGSLFLTKIATQYLFNGNKPTVIACKEECDAKKIFNQLQALISNGTITDKKENPSFYHDMNYAYQNLITVLPNFKDYEGIISSLPEDIKKDFTLDKMYENISNLKIIYNEKGINQILSLITEYDSYLKTKDRYEETKSSMKMISNLSNFDNTKQKISDIEDFIEDTRNSIYDLKKRNEELIELLSETKYSLEVALDTKEAIEEFDTVREEYEKTTKDYNLYMETKEKMDNSRLESIRLKTTIDSLNEKLSNKENTLYMYESLTKDLSKFNEYYDEMTFVKEATSSKKGIPLYIIRKYLNNTEAITNELLDIAYDGKIYIDNFNITPTEFGIPFYNKGVRLDDVKYASQGEISFLSMALSFALSTQTLKKYNIMLLDEVDGALDIRNREKFIEILENQIERIHAEQTFLITHNTMFSSYPVDIIDLSGKNDMDNYPLANFIDIELVD